MPDKEPNPVLRHLDDFVGTWKVVTDDPEEGVSEGRVSFEWMDGRFFLIQHVHDIQANHGIEYIGYDEASKSIKSYFFNTVGELLHYTWEFGDNEHTIWYNEPGPITYFKGRFSDDRNMRTGRWQWPDGGFDVTYTRE